MEWLVPFLSLIGALLGGSVSAIVSNRLAEKRLDVELIREARIVLERWYATRVGPLDPQYPGIDPKRLKSISDQTLEGFFKRCFEESFRLLAALGSVRSWDDRIGDVIDRSDWRIPEDSVPELRIALKDAEHRARRQLWTPRR
ncbi:hypothetical protein [Actinomyces wuliandei]|uniref:hypothetical protein n=1 Tax=Actinomyces wuliandei TaxID=2057743 RepID=UPI000FD8D5D7|nr:hypothetical protein [Actinomyces wuliandei]